MPAYRVARSNINDPLEYKKYTDRLPAIFARDGGGRGIPAQRRGEVATIIVEGGDATKERESGR